MSARLLYVMDPMCSWCWGFAPVAQALIAQAREAGIESVKAHAPDAVADDQSA